MKVRFGFTCRGQADLALDDFLRVAPVLDALQTASPNRFRGIRHSVGWDPHPEVENRGAGGQLASNQFRAGARVLARQGLCLETSLYFPQLPELAAFANLQRDHRISVCIYDPPTASNYVVISGTATCNDQDIWDEARRIIARYTAPDRVDDYVARWKTEPRVLITVTPEHIATRTPATAG